KVGQRLDRENGGDVADVGAVWGAGKGVSVVAPGADAAADERVDHLLRRLRRRRDDADVGAAVAQLLLEVSDGLDGEAVDARADERGVRVEGGDDPEALRREALVAEDRLAEPADADELHLPLAVQPY